MADFYARPKWECPVAWPHANQGDVRRVNLHIRAEVLGGMRWTEFSWIEFATLDSTEVAGLVTITGSFA
jgi:hypothetical protein